MAVIIFIGIVILAFGIMILITLFEHKDDNKCKQCGNRVNTSMYGGFLQKSYRYICDVCGHKWRILEDY